MGTDDDHLDALEDEISRLRNQSTTTRIVSSSSPSPSRRKSNLKENLQLKTSTPIVTPLKLQTVFGSLEPREQTLTPEAELSARRVTNRTDKHFTSMIKSATLVLKSSVGIESDQSQRVLRNTMSRAYAHHRRRDYKSARADYTACIKQHPKWDLPHFNRACLHYKLGNKQEAIKGLDEAIRCNGKDLGYLSCRAMLLREVGNYRAALTDYSRLQQMKDAAGIPRPSSAVFEENSEDATLYALLGKEPALRLRYELRKAAASVKNIKFFTSVDTESLMDLLKLATLGSFSTGDKIFSQGDKADTFFVILKGNVSVVVEETDDKGNIINRHCVKKLHVRDYFGEPAKLRAARIRAASVICDASTKVLKLDYTTFERVLGKFQEQITHDKMNFFGNCRIFKEDFPAKEKTLYKLAQVSILRLYESGTVILSPGKSVDFLYLIRKGVLQITKLVSEKRNNFQDESWVVANGWQLANPATTITASNSIEVEGDDHSESHEVTVATLATGQVFGESCIFHPEMVSQVTIRTLTMAEVYAFRKQDLDSLNLKFNIGTMKALQDATQFNNPPLEKLRQLRKDSTRWQRKKKAIIEDVLQKRIGNTPLDYDAMY